MNRFAELRKLIMELEGDFEKFYDKRNKAAGTRIRKGMQELKSLAQEIRNHVQDIKNDGEDHHNQKTLVKTSKPSKK